MDNQLLGTTHPVMLCVTPDFIESTAVDSGPALQVNAVKVPSSLMLTDLYKVKPNFDLIDSFLHHKRHSSGHLSILLNVKL